MDANKTQRKKEDRNYKECYFEQILEATGHETKALRPLISHLKNYSSKTNKTSDTAEEARTNSLCDVFLLT